MNFSPRDIPRLVMIGAVLTAGAFIVFRTGGFFLLFPVVFLFLTLLRSQNRNGSFPWQEDDPADWWKKGKRE